MYIWMQSNPIRGKPRVILKSRGTNFKCIFEIHIFICQKSKKRGMMFDENLEASYLQECHFVKF